MRATQVFIIFMLSSIVFAANESRAFIGNDNGNGGDFINCSNYDLGPVKKPRDPNLENPLYGKVQLFDYFESKLRGFKYDLNSGFFDLPEHQRATREQMRDFLLNEFLRRIRKFSVTKADLYQRWLKEFFSETEFTEYPLIDVPDTKHTVQPCPLVQVAIQREPLFPEDKRYTIDKYWWNELFQVTGIEQAGLMIHEIILRDALSRGQTNSMRTRYFHSYIASEKFQKLDSIAWQELLVRTGLN